MKLLAPVVPTAYCQNLNATDYPLFQVTIDTTNARCKEGTVQIHSWIEGYTDHDVKTVSLSKGEIQTSSLFPLFKTDVIRRLNNVRRGTLRVQVQQPQFPQFPYDETFPLHLLAYDAALLAMERNDGMVTELSQHLVAWVTPNDRRVQAFLPTVVQYHSRQTLEGYPGPHACDDVALFVREQVKAIYDALKYERHMKYVDSSIVIGNTNEQIMQRVKLPGDTLNTSNTNSSANCLDGTVLFASLLEAINIEPLIMLESGHAYVGWKVFVPGKLEQYEFLETTLIDNADFSEAQQRGLERYQAAIENHLFEKDIYQVSYARKIDVMHWHKHGIHPLG